MDQSGCVRRAYALPRKSARRGSRKSPACPEAGQGFGVKSNAPETPGGRDHGAARGRRQGSGAVSLHQHDPPHRPTGDALDAGQQLDLASPTSTTIVAHALDDIAKQHFPPLKVGLDEEPVLPAPVASDAQHSIQDGNAANGSSIASAPVGSGASPQLVQKVSIGWCPARSNPPEIARWERGEWWLAEYSKPWQPRGCYRGKRQADFWTTNSTVGNLRH